MHTLDLLVLVVYLAGTVLLGARFSRAQRTVRDYFVGARALPWWAIMGSIVATETSTVTFISVPGFAFSRDLTFLQLVLGYLVGRLIVSLLFIPAYFRGELLTVYQLLGQRFGSGVRRLTSSLFLVTRSLADGFRLFATGLVLAALLLTTPGVSQAAHDWIPFASPAVTILAASVFLLGAATIGYTCLGGMSAVVWTDVVQLVVYLVGAVVAAVILLGQIPGGWDEVVSVGRASDKFRVFDFTWDVTRDYTFWSGVIGGAFLTTATHGTDQMMVQRYLGSRAPRAARLALLMSGVVVLAQFVLFMIIGTMLYVYYSQHAPAELASITIAGRLQTDRIFPHFIVTHLPPGVTGLVVAAIFAAAMSTLSSSLNSSAAAAVADFYMPMTHGRRAADHYLRVARAMTVGWGLVQIVVAFVAIELSTSVVDEVLGIASFTNGVILGVFFLGTLTRGVGASDALVGVASGTAVLLAVKLATAVTWQWYVLIGAVATFAAGWASSLASGPAQRMPEWGTP